MVNASKVEYLPTVIENILKLLYSLRPIGTQWEVATKANLIVSLHSSWCPSSGEILKWFFCLPMSDNCEMNWLEIGDGEDVAKNNR